MKDRLLSWGSTLLLVAVLFYTMILGGRQQALRETAKETHAALCSFRADIERRVAASEKFLEDNPNGIPGISAGTIRVSISNQRQTLDSLDKQLVCD